MQEALDALSLISKARDSGPFGFVFALLCLIALRWGGMFVKFLLDNLGIRLTRRQTVEERLSATERQIANLTANYTVFCQSVVDAATIMEAEMDAQGIHNSVLRTFVARLKLARIVLPDVAAANQPARSPPTVEAAG